MGERATLDEIIASMTQDERKAFIQSHCYEEVSPLDGIRLYVERCPPFVRAEWRTGVFNWTRRWFYQHELQNWLEKH